MLCGEGKFCYILISMSVNMKKEKKKRTGRENRKWMKQWLEERKLYTRIKRYSMN